MNMMTELQDVRHGAVLHARMRIAGELVGGARTIEVRNPYTGAVVGTVPKAAAEDIRTMSSPTCRVGSWTAAAARPWTWARVGTTATRRPPCHSGRRPSHLPIVTQSQIR